MARQKTRWRALPEGVATSNYGRHEDCGPVLVWYRATVRDAGPASHQHWGRDHNRADTGHNYCSLFLNVRQDELWIKDKMALTLDESLDFIFTGGGCRGYNYVWLSFLGKFTQLLWPWSTYNLALITLPIEDQLSRSLIVSDCYEITNSKTETLLIKV